MCSSYARESIIRLSMSSLNSGPSISAWKEMPDEYAIACIIIPSLAFDFKSSLNTKYKNEMKITTQIFH